jgi:hypothetical protein
VAINVGRTSGKASMNVGQRWCMIASLVFD